MQYDNLIREEQLRESSGIELYNVFHRHWDKKDNQTLQEFSDLLAAQVVSEDLHKYPDHIVDLSLEVFPSKVTTDMDKIYNGLTIGEINLMRELWIQNIKSQGRLKDTSVLADRIKQKLKKYLEEDLNSLDEGLAKKFEEVLEETEKRRGGINPTFVEGACFGCSIDVYNHEPVNDNFFLVRIQDDVETHTAVYKFPKTSQLKGEIGVLQSKFFGYKYDWYALVKKITADNQKTHATQDEWRASLEEKMFLMYEFTRLTEEEEEEEEEDEGDFGEEAEEGEEEKEKKTAPTVRSFQVDTPPAMCLVVWREDKITKMYEISDRQRLESLIEQKNFQQIRELLQGSPVVQGSPLEVQNASTFVIDVL